ncbi:hypothetical protein HOG48_01485 [Candidatus Peregrinibacteria bacterium]|jgi:hypothetical protein|nr:hypothetical protein [Candidatus Peregrinibacteria bacterium]
MSLKLKKGSFKEVIRTLYLYAVCGITMIMIIVAGVNTVKLGLDTYVFKIDMPRYYDMACDDVRYVGGEEILRTDKEITKCEERAEKNAGEKLTNERKRDLSNAIAMLLIAIPFYLYHWSVVKHEHGEKKGKKKRK